MERGIIYSADPPYQKPCFDAHQKGISTDHQQQEANQPVL
tara:strand:- start:17865 stop:17984 length:120 start_codon:yes stop_codon:yes gene_type:complete